jgi:hypothetical protein
LVETAVGDAVTLHVWGGDGYAVVEGTVDAIEPNPDFPDDAAQRFVVLVEDSTNAYLFHQIVQVRPAASA